MERKYQNWKDKSLYNMEKRLYNQTKGAKDKDTPAIRARKREWGKVNKEITKRKRQGEWDPDIKEEVLQFDRELRESDPLQEQGEVEVGSYTKKDGTKVRSHTRSRPT